jgi:hypothetical protein
VIAAYFLTGKLLLLLPLMLMCQVLLLLPPIV